MYLSVWKIGFWVKSMHPDIIVLKVILPIRNGVVGQSISVWGICNYWHIEFTDVIYSYVCVSSSKFNLKKTLQLNK